MYVACRMHKVSLALGCLSSGWRVSDRALAGVQLAYLSCDEPPSKPPAEGFDVSFTAAKHWEAT